MLTVANLGLPRSGIRRPLEGLFPFDFPLGNGRMAACQRPFRSTPRRLSETAKRPLRTSGYRRCAAYRRSAVEETTAALNLWPPKFRSRVMLKAQGAGRPRRPGEQTRMSGGAAA